MPAVLPPEPLLGAFVLASLILTLTPGPAVFFILTCSVVQGRAAGLTSAIGVALGSLCNAAAAAVGLAALFALSPHAFVLVKYAGAAYLLVLGMRALLARGTELAPEASTGPTALLPVFRDAFMVALLNPTTTLFFAVFLPQFLTPTPAMQTPVLPALALGSIFVLIGVCTDSLYALAAGSAHRWFVQHKGIGKGGKIVEGLVFIALGLYAALGGLQ